MRSLNSIVLRRFAVFIALTSVMYGVAFARIVKSWTLREMFDKSDLVVIASVIQSRDNAGGVTMLEGLPVIGVNTSFRPLLILKGPTLDRFDLHHYRLQNSADENIANGPNLLRIDGYHPAFLLFLLKDGDNIYVPVTGQADAAIFSALQLNGAFLGEGERDRK